MKTLVLVAFLLINSTLNAQNTHSLGCISAYDAGYEIASWKQQGMDRIDAINKVKDIIVQSENSVSLEQFNFLIQTVNDIYDSNTTKVAILAYQTQVNCESIHSF